MKSLFPSLVDSDDEEDNGLSGTGSSSKKLITNRASGMSFYPDVQLYGRELFEQELQQQIPVYVHPDDPNAPLPNDGYNPVLNRDSLGDFDGMMYEGLSGGEVPKAGDQVYIPTAIGYDDMGSTDAISSDEVYSFEDHSKNLKKQASASLGRSVEALHQKKENAMSRDRFTPNAALDDGRNMGVDYSRDFYNHSEYGDYVKETPKVAIRELGDPLSEIEGESKNPVVQFNSLPRFGRNINSSRFSSSITDYLQNDGRLEQTGFGIYENAVTPAQEGAIIVGSGIDYATASMGEIFDEAEAGSEGLGNVRQGHEPAIVLHNKALQKALLSSYNKIDRHQDMQEASEKQVKKLIQAGASQSIVNKQKANALAHQCAALQEACSFIQTSKKLIQGLQGHLSNKGLKKNQAIAMREDLAVIHAVCNSVLAACFTQAKDASQKAFALCQYWGKLAQAKPENKLAVSMLANCKKLAAHCKKCLQACSHFAKNSRKASMGAYTAGSGDMGLARQISDSMGAYTAGSGDMGLARQISESMGEFGVAYDYDLHDRIDSYDMESDNAGLDLAGGDFLACYGTLGDADHDEDDDGLQGLSGFDGLDCVSGLSDMSGWLSTLKKGLKEAGGVAAIVANPVLAAGKLQLDAAKKVVSSDVAARIHSSVKKQVKAKGTSEVAQAFQRQADSKLARLNAELKTAQGARLSALKDQIATIQRVKAAMPKLLADADARRKEYATLCQGIKTLEASLKVAPAVAQAGIKSSIASAKAKKVAAKDALVKAVNAVRTARAVCTDMGMVQKKLALIKPAYTNLFQAYDKAAKNPLINSNIKQSIQQLRSTELAKGLAEVEALIKKGDTATAATRLDAMRRVHDELARFLGAVLNQRLPVLFAHKAKLVTKPAPKAISPKLVSTDALQSQAAKIVQAAKQASDKLQAAKTAEQARAAKAQAVAQASKALAIAESSMTKVKQSISQAKASSATSPTAIASMQNAAKAAAAISALTKAAPSSVAPNAATRIAKLSQDAAKLVQAAKSSAPAPVKPIVMPTKTQVAAQLATKKVGLAPQKNIAALIQKPKLVPGQNLIKASGTQTKALVDTRDERAGIANLKNAVSDMGKYHLTNRDQVGRLSEGKALLDFISKNVKSLQAIIKRCDSNIEVINHFNDYLLKNKKPVAADSKKALELEKTINIDLAKANATIIDPFKKLVEAYKTASIRKGVPAAEVKTAVTVVPQQLPAVVAPTTATPPQPQITAEAKQAAAQAPTAEPKTVEVAVRPAPTSDAPKAVEAVAEVKSPATEIQAQAQSLVAAQPDVTQKDIDVGNALFEKAGIRFTSLAARHQKYLQQMAVLLAADVAKNILKGDEAVQILQNQIGDKVVQQIQEAAEGIDSNAGGAVEETSVDEGTAEALGSVLGAAFSMEDGASYGLKSAFEQFWSDDILSEDEYKIIRDLELKRIQAGAAMIPTSATAPQIEAAVAASQGETTATTPSISVEEAVVVSPQAVAESIVKLAPISMLSFKSSEDAAADDGDDLLNALTRVGSGLFSTIPSSEASSKSIVSAPEETSMATETEESSSVVPDSLESAPSEATEEVMQGFTDWLSNITP